MELNKRSRYLSIVAALALLTTTIACAANDDPASVDGDRTRPPTASAPASSAAASPIEDRWIQHLTLPEMEADLRAAGLEQWTEEFFTAERLTGPQTVVWDFDTASDTFSVAYHEADGTWHVGWKGPLDVDDSTMTLTDDFSGAVQAFAWKLDGDEMTLTPRSSSVEQLKGIPIEVYDVAYMTQPLARTDCPMTPGQDCR
jgi:hypothetical protein